MTTALTPQDVALFIATHKPAYFPEGKTFYPIQVGAKQAKQRFDNMIHDDEGENISELNPMYCELTALYWAWKNDACGDNPKQYYGLCHYRRYFDCSTEKHDENDYGEVMSPSINESTLREYGLNDDALLEMLEGKDVVTTPLNDVRRIGGYTNLKEHYDQAGELHLKDLRRIFDILCTAHPEYREDAETVFNSHEASFCNMAIMRTEIFKAYCEWLFPLLESFTKTTDMTTYSLEAYRTPGHLAERLLNVFLHHHERIQPGDWRIHRCQCVHFEHTDPPQVLAAMSAHTSDSEQNATDDMLTTTVNTSDPVVPVVFAASNSYVPMLTTTLASLLENSSSERKYDLVVLHRDITLDNQEIMRDFVETYPQAVLRFVNISTIIDQYTLKTHNEHISTETYLRFLIQDVLSCYDKVVYSDADLIFEADVAKLFDTDLKGQVVGAVKDIDFMGNVNLSEKRRKYATDILKLDDPYAYFQAGVLLLDLPKMRNIFSVREWLLFSSSLPFIYDDQDVLNSACKNRITFLDARWNVMHDCAGRVDAIFSKAPHEAFAQYRQARTNPYVIHYAGFDKPWKNPWCDFATRYWHYAQRTPYALQLASMASGKQAPQNTQPRRLLAQDSPLRKVVDLTAPSGTKRRELAKTLVKKLQKR